MHRVIWWQGMDVVEAIAALPRVKDNTNSPFFQAGKMSGGWVGGSNLRSNPSVR